MLEGFSKVNMKRAFFQPMFKLRNQHNIVNCEKYSKQHGKSVKNLWEKQVNIFLVESNREMSGLLLIVNTPLMRQTWAN